MRQRHTTTKHRDAAVQRYYDPGTGQFMSLDPLNKMTNAGYTFVRDNPFGGTDPSGRLFASGNGGGCVQLQESGTNPCVSTKQLQSFSPSKCVGVVAGNGSEVSQSSDLCGPPEKSFTQAIGSAAVHSLNDVRQAAAVTGKALATVADRARCIAIEFNPLPGTGTGNGGGDLIVAGVTAGAITMVPVEAAVTEGQLELLPAAIPIALVGSATAVYLTILGAQRIGTECFG